MQLNKVFKDKDINYNLLESKRIAVIGYGNQGRAQALNLKDSGNDVIIGLRENSENIKLAKLDGFEVFSISKAIELSVLASILIQLL